jgi:hypothetical protein
MLISIRRGPSAFSGPSGEDQVVSLLLACHERIRSFLALASRLAAAEESASISDAAAGLFRYFGEALPLHSLDEDASITPRLIEAHAGIELRSAFDTGAREHAIVDEIITSLLPIWIEIARDSSRIAARRATLATGTAFLEDLFTDHLEREERLVFPAVADLPAAIQATIVGEMRARRTSANATAPDR